MVCLSLLLSLQLAHGFYLPGVAPQDFKKKDPVMLKVNKLSSVKTQLPYEYYSLPYCRPDKITSFAENLGEVLRGDRIENSLYQFYMRTDEQCKVLCRIESLSAAQSKAFKDKIADDYKVNMILDNLPVAMVKVLKDEDGKQMKSYERGYYVGFKATLEGQKVSTAIAACGPGAAGSLQSGNWLALAVVLVLHPCPSSELSLASSGVAQTQKHMQIFKFSFAASLVDTSFDTCAVMRGSLCRHCVNNSLTSSVRPPAYPNCRTSSSTSTTTCASPSCTTVTQPLTFPAWWALRSRPSV